MIAGTVTTKRKALAVTLRAAMLDMDEAGMMASLGGELPPQALTQWLRVADTAIKLLVEQPGNLRRPAIALVSCDIDRLMVETDKAVAAHFARQSQGAPPKPAYDGKLFCEQCDRRVSTDRAQTCTSNFCSLRPK